MKLWAMSSALIIGVFGCQTDLIKQPEVEAAMLEISQKTSCRTWRDGCLWRDSSWLIKKANVVTNKLNDTDLAIRASYQMVWVNPEGLYEVMSWRRQVKKDEDLAIYSEASKRWRYCRVLVSGFSDSVLSLSTSSFDSSYSESIAILVNRATSIEVCPVNFRVGDYVRNSLVCY